MKVVFVKNLINGPARQKLYAVEDGTCIVISGVLAFPTGNETYIFHSNIFGEVINWSELPGSFRGDIDFEKALSDGGYFLCDEKWEWVHEFYVSIIDEGCYRIDGCDLFIEYDILTDTYIKYDIDTKETIGYYVPNFLKHLNDNNKIIKLTEEDLMIRDIIK